MVPGALASSGRFVCLACDLGDPAVEVGPTSASYSWGNEHSMTRMCAAYRFLLGPQVGARAGSVVVVGTSMGATVGLNWALRHKELVAALILACPVLDLVRLYLSDAGGLSLSIGTAYGLDRHSDGSQLCAWSPMSYAPRLAGLPICIYSSSDDPIAADTEACKEFASRVGGDGVRIVELGAAGHWPAGTPVEDTLAFLRDYV